MSTDAVSNPSTDAQVYHQETAEELIEVVNTEYDYARALRMLRSCPQAAACRSSDGLYPIHRVRKRLPPCITLLDALYELHPTPLDVQDLVQEMSQPVRDWLLRRIPFSEILSSGMLARRELKYLLRDYKGFCSRLYLPGENDPRILEWTEDDILERIARQSSSTLCALGSVNRPLPIYYAVKLNMSHRIMEALHARDPDAAVHCQRSKQFRKPLLFLAVERNMSPETLRMLWSESLAMSHYGQLNPLHVVQSLDVARVLFSLTELDIFKWRDPQGRLPLHHLANRGYMVQEAIDAYPDACMAQDFRGNRPIDYATDLNRWTLCDPLDPLNALIRACPKSLSSRGSDGMTPLFRLLVTMEHDRSSSLRAVLQTMLDRCPESCMVESSDGDLPTHYAMRSRRDVDVCIALINAGGPPSLTTLSRKSNRTALMECDDLDLVRALVRKCPDLMEWKTPDESMEDPPLFQILKYFENDEQFIREALQSSGHQISRVVANDGDTILHRACQLQWDPELIPLIVKVDPGLLGIANKRGRLPVHDLLENFDERTEDYASIFLGDPALAWTLTSCNELGMPPLHSVVTKFRQYSDQCSKLVRTACAMAPCTMDICDRSGDPLALAVLPSLRSSNGNSCLEIIGAILDLDAKAPRRRNERTGECMLHRAISNRLSHKTLRTILDADPEAATVPTRNGLLPYHIFVSSGGPARRHSDHEVAWSRIVSVHRVLLGAYPEAAMTLVPSGAPPVIHAAIAGHKSLEFILIMLQACPESTELVRETFCRLDR